MTICSYHVLAGMVEGCLIKIGVEQGDESQSDIAVIITCRPIQDNDITNDCRAADDVPDAYIVCFRNEAIKGT